MNTFNRICAIIFLLVGMIGSAIVLFLLVNSPDELIRPLQVYLDSVAQVMANTSYANRLSFGFGMGGIIWICLGFIFWLETKPLAKTTIRVTKLADKHTEVEVNLVAQRLAYSLHRLSDVHGAEPTIRTRRNKVDVDLRLAVAPVVNIPMKTREVQALTRELITEQMGLQVGQIAVSLKHGSEAAIERQESIRTA